MPDESPTPVRLEYRPAEVALEARWERRLDGIVGVFPPPNGRPFLGGAVVRLLLSSLLSIAVLIPAFLKAWDQPFGDSSWIFIICFAALGILEFGLIQRIVRVMRAQLTRSIVQISAGTLSVNCPSISGSELQVLISSIQDISICPIRISSVQVHIVRLQVGLFSGELFSVDIASSSIEWVGPFEAELRGVLKAKHAKQFCGLENPIA